jgi:lipopolysaccharide/colanic/teichoic acid biosynthesis glycosyltransferase
MNGRKRNRFYRIGQRSRDILVSFCGIILLLPFWLIIAAVIVADDPHGSPIFSQIRCGKDGKLFRMYKFRSMRRDAESRFSEVAGLNERDGPAFKMENDPRTTRVGRFIRKTNIDEFPQLWNVLKGNMSLVGPRPALPGEVRQYDAFQRQRLAVTPGLTCYWQIRRDKNRIPFDEWVALDLKYIEERSLRTDWRILFRTIRMIMPRRKMCGGGKGGGKYGGQAEPGAESCHARTEKRSLKSRRDRGGCRGAGVSSGGKRMQGNLPEPENAPGSG